jgi:hypothetical protein
MATGPTEVWLTQRNLAVKCMIVREDESAERFTARSLNMRGAQREVTARLKGQGHAPAGRWETVVSNAAGTETMRRFR